MDTGVGLTALRLAVAVLAAWRIAHALAFEDGPFALARRARAAAARRGVELDCFHCLSLWAAAPLALWPAATATDWLCMVPAISGAACLLQRASAAPVLMQPLSLPDDEVTRDELLRHDAPDPTP